MKENSLSNNQDIRNKIIQKLLEQDVQIVSEDPLENTMVLNMGPSHPSTHGVLRVLLKLDGETVVDAMCDVGYLHRGFEKIAENSTYHEFIPHTDRLDYLSPLSNNVAIALAIEKVAGITAPPRAQYIRTILCELARISSHLMAIGSVGIDLGALTYWFYTFTEREKLYDIFDLVVGARFTTSFTRIGGISHDITEEGIQAIKVFIKELPNILKKCEKLLNRNRIFIDRTQGIGKISLNDALNWGLSGPNLRASGSERDLRKDEPYLIYPELDFDVPYYNEGDTLARFLIRIDEIYESLRIIEQALKKLPEGEIISNDPKNALPRKEKIYTKMEELINDFMLVNFGINPPVGEIYQAIESSKGELGFYIVSDGSGYPWRLKIRSPSFCNLQVLPLLLKGQMISDVVAIIGSIDPVMGECDK
ncbi:MAG TPA: NADH dehydrogenase (quinone) subunit D [Ignavibacteria bacterium]